MDIVMPQLGETVTEGTVVVWHKKVGEQVTAQELLFEVSTDKVDTEVPAPADGILAEILVAEGETVPVGTRLGILEREGEAVASAIVAPAATATVSRPARAARGPGRQRDAKGNPLSPVVRRLIAEHALNAAVIPGSGEGGRIKRDDVLAFLRRQEGVARRDPSDKVIELSRLRRQIGDHMVRSKATSPHVLQAVEVDFHGVERTRTACGAGWQAHHGFTLTYLPFIARAVCRAIPDFPNINASIDGDQLILHGRINLGIAVDLNFEGLMVPVLKDAQDRKLAELATGIHDLARRARAGELKPDDLTEGTYTLSNSGPFGTLITAPVINQPQVAILSTDEVRKKPVVIEGAVEDEIAIRPVGVLAQSFDHRAFDGAYSAAFLNRVREILETADWDSQLG